MAWQGNGKGAAWAWHAMCELAFSVSESNKFDSTGLDFITVRRKYW